MVVMGVCGVGKTQVAKGLQERAGVAVYLEGDTFHSEENKEKMRKRESGENCRNMLLKIDLKLLLFLVIPLTAEDRVPWMESIRSEALRTAREDGAGVVLACSCLGKWQRDLLRGCRDSFPTLFLHLHAERGVIEERLGARKGHYMKKDMLDSQV